jgi:hypothetical protein
MVAIRSLLLLALLLLGGVAPPSLLRGGGAVGGITGADAQITQTGDAFQVKCVACARRCACTGVLAQRVLAHACTLTRMRDALYVRCSAKNQLNGISVQQFDRTQFRQTIASYFTARHARPAVTLLQPHRNPNGSASHSSCSHPPPSAPAD